MGRDSVFVLALVTFCGWRLHPGWSKEGARSPPSLADCAAMAYQVTKLCEEVLSEESPRWDG